MNYDFSTVIFSDEKRFCLWTDGPVHIWQRDNQRLVAKYVSQTSKNKKAVMVWLAINSSGESLLLRCDDLQDSLSYQNTILARALPFIRRRSTAKAKKVIFMQDGAPCHTSASTLRWLRNNRVKLLTNWPACSPDPNPVENIWSMLAQAMVGQCFSTQDAIFNAVQAALSEIPQRKIAALYTSMIRRLSAVSLAKGAHTKC